MNDDFISRSALLESAYMTGMWNRKTQQFDLCVVDFEDVQDAPAVDAEVVRHGRWVHPEGHVVANEFFCSECNKRTVSLRPVNRQSGGMLLADENGNFYYPPTMKYCSDCGARMDGDEHAAD